MPARTVTIFGGSGFLGRHLIKRLAARGYIIRVPTRDPNRALHLKPMGDVGQIVLERWDGSLEPSQMQRYLEGSSLVVNLVGILHERRAGDFTRLHAELPRALAGLAREMGARRLLHVSALGADPASPSLYARTKAEGEAAVCEGFPGATIFRPSIVFGPEDQFFNRFARMSQISPVLPVVGAKTRFQPVYVGDVGDAAVAALESEDAAGTLYELGGPRIYSFEELLRYMLRVLGRRRLVLELPEGLARLIARFAEWLPEPPLTRDQILLLARDNVVSGAFPGLAELGVAATPLEAIVPEYLTAYARPGPRARFA